MIISKLRVMKSAAGYYMGRGYMDENLLQPGFKQHDLALPYERQSEYFETYQDAYNYLLSFAACEAPDISDYHLQAADRITYGKGA